jgi:hypothetical protein
VSIRDILAGGAAEFLLLDFNTSLSPGIETAGQREGSRPSLSLATPLSPPRNPQCSPPLMIERQLSKPRSPKASGRSYYAITNTWTALRSSPRIWGYRLNEITLDIDANGVVKLSAKDKEQGMTEKRVPRVIGILREVDRGG